MTEEAHSLCEVLVVGAGPAGMAAAVAASESGASVQLLDNNPEPGGQIWRRSCSREGSAGSGWAGKLRRPNVRILCGMEVVQLDMRTRTLFADENGSLRGVGFSKLILATGARERLLPFPGWTLPNVLAAGGLQAMVKSGLPVRGKRIVVAGTGPLLLPVAAYLRAQGAAVLAICEQASWRSLLRFGWGLLRRPAKLKQAFGLASALRGIPFWANSWVLRAEGSERLRSVLVERNGVRTELDCDFLAVGFHLVPNTELASAAGCALRAGFVVVDANQQTSEEGVFCAGEPISIGGVDSALLEGQIAGFAATGQSAPAKRLRHRLLAERPFVRALERTFQLRSELRGLPDESTIVCRCEDVIHARTARYDSWREAKNQTRCGMGPCQGRICGPATQFLYGWNTGSVRPPVFPVRVQTLADMAGETAQLSDGEMRGY